jgi:hypothetical protein
LFSLDGDTDDDRENRRHGRAGFSADLLKADLIFFFVPFGVPNSSSGKSKSDLGGVVEGMASSIWRRTETEFDSVVSVQDSTSLAWNETRSF